MGREQWDNFYQAREQLEKIESYDLSEYVADQVSVTKQIESLL